MRGEIILDQAGEERDRDAEADRAGREIDRDLVLGPAGIALRAAEAAEILQRLAALRAEQIMDRVEHRPGVRLDRDAVVVAERVEIERGHDRGHRRAARLVPADLQPVVTVADVVGVVDGPRRQPAQPLVERLQRFDVGGRRASAWRRLAERAARERKATRSAHRVNFDKIRLSASVPSSSASARNAAALSMRWTKPTSGRDRSAGRARFKAISESGPGLQRSASHARGPERLCVRPQRSAR